MKYKWELPHIIITYENRTGKWLVSYMDSNVIAAKVDKRQPLQYDIGLY